MFITRAHATSLFSSCSEPSQALFLSGNTIMTTSSGMGYSAAGFCTDAKENQLFLIYKEIHSGALAKSYMRKGFRIYEERRKYFPIYEEAVNHI